MRGNPNTENKIIEVKNLVKRFRFWAERPDNLKSFLVDFMKGKTFRQKPTEITVLNDISFDINSGDFIGIMGKNGAGKSTLMRLITGIYEPSEGSVKVHGKIAPLISLGAGFNPELSGLENIYLNASILGFGRKQTQEKLSSIIEFSELADFMHMPIKNYSSGMVVRLGFSIASHLEAPILLLDEILGVGDKGFADKSMNKIFQLYAEGRTIVMVTHNPDIVKAHCTRCIVIKDGRKAFDGEAKKGALVYSQLFSEKPN